MNIHDAVKKVTQNKGSAGIDGMAVDELPACFNAHWDVQTSAGSPCRDAERYWESASAWLNRRMPNGLYGGVRGWGLAAPACSIGLLTRHHRFQER